MINTKGVKTYLTALLCTMAIMSYGQSGMSVGIVEVSSASDAQTCVHLEVKNLASDESTMLSSQNYRLFYSAGSIGLIDSTVQLALPSDIYQLRMVQHVDGVDASGTGDLPFEDKLGFINFSVVQSNLQRPGIEVSTSPVSIVEMCFENKNPDQVSSIVLARENVTTSYGRAYIELSVLGEGEQILPSTVKEYKDYNSSF